METFRTSDNFLNMASNTQVTEEKVDKLDYIEIKNFCASKTTINRGKKQLMA